VPRPQGRIDPAAARTLQILDAQTAGVATLPTHLDIASSGTAMATPFTSLS
jgi:hypothetical protein